MAQSQYKYKVVPFFPIVKISSGGSFVSAEIATQLAALIEKETADGSEFYRVDKVDVYGKPGCLGMILGLFGLGSAREVNFQYDVVTFRKGSV